MENSGEAGGRRARLRRFAERAAAGTTGRNAAMTVAGGFGVQFALLVSGILVARLLGVEDRGYLALFWVIALVMAFVGTTGLHSSITYWIAREPEVGHPLARLMLRAGALQSVAAVLVQAAVLAITIDDAADSVQVAAAISLGVVPAMAAVFYGMAFLQGLEHFREWTVIRLLPALLYTLGVIVLALVDAAGLIEVTAVWVGSYYVTAAISVVRSRRALPADSGRPAPSFAELQRFGAKAFLGSASPTDTLQLDQLLVGLFLSPASLGLYVVGLAFTNLPRIVAQSVGFVVYPHVARRPDPKEARRAMWRATALTALVVGVIVATLEAVAGWLVPLFFGDEFRGAIELTRILLIAGALVSVRRVLGDGARGAGYPGLGSIAEVASAVVLIPLMAILAETNGVTGVAWALVIAAAAGLLALIVGLLRADRGPAGEGLPPLEESGVTVAAGPGPVEGMEPN